MASSFSPLPFQLLLLLLVACSTSATNNSSSSTSTSTTLNTHVNAIETVCKSTPHPELCIDTLKLSISINSSPSPITFFHDTLQTAITEVTKLTGVFPATGSSGGIIEKQKSSIQDCKDLHKITLSSLQISASLFQSTGGAKRVAAINAHLSAALTNKMTCLEGLSTASGPLLPNLVHNLTEAYKHVSNSLAIVAKSSPRPARHNRRLLGQFPSWLKSKDRRLLNGYGTGGGGALTLVVSKDGLGQFRTVSDAVAYAPSKSDVRTFIVVKAGVYEENVEIPSDKINIALLGDGSYITVIRGSRSVGDGWTTFRTATVAVSAEGFLARDITIENTAGAAKFQAVALRLNADQSALYRCTIAGYQDTLYVHSFRQFYRECNIYGTVDFIFGNAAVVFQKSNIIARLPLNGQYNTITAQGRDDPNEDTGISIQYCCIVPSVELAAGPRSAKTYLGRPWWPYSRTVYMESFLHSSVDPAGWMEWDGRRGLDTLYYGEYENSGPGSPTYKRVSWPGYHVMDHNDAVDFTVSALIEGNMWLSSTSFPYDDGV